MPFLVSWAPSPNDAIRRCSVDDRNLEAIPRSLHAQAGTQEDSSELIEPGENPLPHVPDVGGAFEDMAFAPVAHEFGALSLAVEGGKEFFALLECHVVETALPDHERSVRDQAVGGESAEALSHQEQVVGVGDA